MYRHIKHFAEFIEFSLDVCTKVSDLRDLLLAPLQVRASSFNLALRRRYHYKYQYP